MGSFFFKSNLMVEIFTYNEHFSRKKKSVNCTPTSVSVIWLCWNLYLWRGVFTKKLKFNCAAFSVSGIVSLKSLSMKRCFHEIFKSQLRDNFRFRYSFFYKSNSHLLVFMARLLLLVLMVVDAVKLSPLIITEKGEPRTFFPLYFTVT